MKNDVKRESDTFGSHLTNLRTKKGLTQADLATTAGISAGYYCAIENDKRLPPPAATLARILVALECNGTELDLLTSMAATERLILPLEKNLPEEVQALIVDLRAHGHLLPDSFVKALRVNVREAHD